MPKEDVLEIIKDEEFLNKIINLTDIESVKKVFKSRGVDVSDQDIEEMRKGAAYYMNDHKVSDEFLGNISGGLTINIGNNQTHNGDNYVSTQPRSSNTSSRSMTNVEGVLCGSVFSLVGAFVMFKSVSGGIKNGWLSPM